MLGAVGAWVARLRTGGTSIVVYSSSTAPGSDSPGRRSGYHMVALTDDRSPKQTPDAQAGAELSYESENWRNYMRTNGARYELWSLCIEWDARMQLSDGELR